MFSPQNSTNQNQQWPFADNVKPGGHIELIATISVVLVFILISLNLYVRHRHRHRNHVVITIHRTRATPSTTANAEGLDAVAIAALPTFIYRAGSSTNGCTDECAVCLNVAEEGEMMRLLPKCKHVFHIDCIDMWLNSHSTCPVCRTSARQTIKSEIMELLAMPPFPERFGHSGGGRAAQEGVSESSQVSRAGNGPRRWLSTVEDGIVDIERQ